MAINTVTWAGPQNRFADAQDPQRWILRISKDLMQGHIYKARRDFKRGQDPFEFE